MRGRAEGYLPKMRVHSSGQYVVTLSRQDHYLGRLDDPECRKRYEEVLGRWLAGGRKQLRKPKVAGCTVQRVADRYLEEIARTSVKRGEETSHVVGCRVAMRRLAELYGTTEASEFNMDSFRLVRESWLGQPNPRGGALSRKTINTYTGFIRRAFRLAVEEGLVPTSVWSEIAVVKNLTKGRSRAAETKKVRPAQPEAVEAVLADLGGVRADLLRVMMLTGMRPAEACAMKVSELDRSGPVWIYRVSALWNKTEHRDIDRSVAIGPRAREIVAHRMEGLGGRDGPVFRTHTTGEAFEPDSITKAVARCCLRLGVAKWTPNQLRHNFATEARRRFSKDAAQVCLGHQDSKTTEIYAEPDLSLAIQVAAEMG